MVAHGQSDEVIRCFGDHAVGSAFTFLCQHETGQEVRPLLFATREGGLLVRDIQRVRQISSVELNEIEVAGKIVESEPESNF